MTYATKITNDDTFKSLIKGYVEEIVEELKAECGDDWLAHLTTDGHDMAWEKAEYCEHATSPEYALAICTHCYTHHGTMRVQERGYPWWDVRELAMATVKEEIRGRIERRLSTIERIEVDARETRKLQEANQ